MADTKISDLAAASTLAGTEVVPVVQSGSTVKATVAQLLAAAQPLDSDLTAIAALSTTAFGRALLALADAAAGRTALGLGTAALSAAGDFQPVDSDLTAIAALSTTAYGRGLLTDADAAAFTTRLTGLLNGTYAPAASKATYADRKNRTSGDITVNGTSWANLDTGLDITLTAAAGNIVEVGLSAQHGAGAVQLVLDVVSIVAGSPVNSWGLNGAESATAEGIASWVCFSGVNGKTAGSITKVLTAGDISGGQVLLRLRARTASATNKVLFSSANYPITFWAINHG